MRNILPFSRLTLSHKTPFKSNLAPDSQPALAYSAASCMFTGSAATVNWVHCQSGVGRFIKDRPPQALATSSFFFKPQACRFSNFLNCYLTVTATGKIENFGFFQDSGIYRAPSFLKLPSQGYTVLQAARIIYHEGRAGVEFDQIAGARTLSATLIGGMLGGLLGSLPGFLLGAYLANRLMNFPPIWTHLRLRLMADGQQTISLVGHSLFPCNTLYQRLEDGLYRASNTFEALQPQQLEWSSTGWGASNPWNITRPAIGLFSAPASKSSLIQAS